MPVSGGAPRVIADAFQVEGGTWAEDGTLVYAPHWNQGLLRLAPGGGAAQPLTTLDAKSEAGHVWPQFLPGGRALVFTVEVQGKGFDDARIEVLELATNRRRVLIEGGTYGRYVRTGHLIYVRASTLWAAPFDLRSLSLKGPAVAVLEGVDTDVGYGAARVAVASSGTLAFIAGRAARTERTLEWMDRQCRLAPVSDVRRSYGSVRLSPDGRRIAVHINSANDDIWTFDLASGTLTRLTFASENEFPLWAPDGQRLIFDSDRDGAHNLYWIQADGAGSAERLASSAHIQFPTSVASDGATLLFAQQSARGDWDTWALPLAGERVPRELLASPFNEIPALLSHDGRFLAYQSDEAGQDEIYVQPFPGPGGKRQVSLGGGHDPIWSRDGKELFFRRSDGWLMAAPVSLTPAFSVGRPAPLCDPPPLQGYDVAPDGRFIVIRKSEAETASREIRLILNWTEELKRRVPR